MTAGLNGQLVVTEPGLYDDMTDVDYHADPVPGGSLSSTFARLLTRHVPAKAVEERHKAPTRAMQLGTAVHAQALGTGPELIVWQLDGRTKAGKAERAAAAEAINAGLAVAVDDSEHDQIVGMAEVLRSHLELRGLLDTSRKEVSGFWREGPIWARARYDLLGDCAYDYKTSEDVSRRGFSRAMGKFGYHQQGDWYERGLRALGHPAAAAGPLRFICQEKTPPYLVQIHTPDEEAAEVARILNDRAIEVFHHCTRTNTWPGYADLHAEPAALPSFYFFDNADVLPEQWRPLEQEMQVPS